ncbi:hydantoinase/oxoprolinase family protein [Rhizobiaceae bacterium BDR2-2]|uniref:Hydantoinase/oxoprolinase family protein n=1 Tax=Ectorhizobium quercum TaxID=2965071 RepID=A0AAE3N282_9HYPH|nr:hydantoinase/oxoprolinase family protein [Ectorhizobium quercum]MCX8997307.1 hydantoinase/oxoprolinase family protein [Ectorhizobium quercum]
MSQEQPKPSQAHLRVGVDSGGTFTDVCVFDETTGDIFVWKVSSTPHDPSEGIATGIEQALKELGGGIAASGSVCYFGHGTTVGTNALITGRGADTGLLTTAGFRDVLEIRRQKRPELYDLQTVKPPILASRDKRLEVRERILFDGTVETPLNEEDVREAVRRLRAEGVGAIAICTLFSFIEPRHEARIRAIVEEEYPGVFISVSHEIAPEFREYERLSTTVVNAYLGPIMRAYLERLSPRLETIGVQAEPHLTQSNGGVISCETAKAQPVRTVLSGPAAGVMAALTIGEATGHHNLVTFDMGGTSSDVSLIDQGRPQMANDIEVHGYPLKVPMLDIHTVGAGGGSIAHVDNGLLKVGPRSAGAAPGPVCYGLGNDEPTVTDANVVLGVLNQTHLLNGRMAIDASASRAAMERLAAKLGIGVMETAQGIIRVVVANMAKAIRVISVERGYDPRDYVMLAFGGAGPIHAARLAAELDIPRVMIPKHPGIMCAMGLLQSDLRTNLALTRMMRLGADSLQTLEAGFAQLEARADDWFAAERIPADHRRLHRAVDMRYGGQGYELTVAWPEHVAPGNVLGALRRNFEDAHRQLYGYVADGEPIQITTLRAEAVGVVPKAELKSHPPATIDVSNAVIGTRTVWLPETGDFVPVPLYDRDRLQPGHVVAGPAVIEQMDSTTLVLPAQTATVDAYLNLMLEAQG